MTTFSQTNHTQQSLSQDSSGIITSKLYQPAQISPDLLSLSPDLAQQVVDLLNSSRQSNVPSFQDLPDMEKIYIPVPDGEIRILHYCPSSPESVRPLVFVPGWGVTPSVFTDWFEVLYNRVEFYYIETREKDSSRMHRWKSQFTMSRKAADIQLAIEALGLQERDFVLMGSCWGAAMILQGVMDHTIQAPTIITVDPMHAIWYSKFVLKYLAPILPAWVFNLLRPILKRSKLRNMHEPIQRQRAIDVIDSAVLWKWRKAGIQTHEFELYGNLHKIKEEIFVFNGTNDAIHDQSDYPRIATQLPRGRFIFMKTGEENREWLMGLVGREFTQVYSSDKVPSVLQPFEKFLMREDIS